MVKTVNYVSSLGENEHNMIIFIQLTCFHVYMDYLSMQAQYSKKEGKPLGRPTPPKTSLALNPGDSPPNMLRNVCNHWMEVVLSLDKGDDTD
jgi:hypothetical protein